jgi:hypothetical protein
MSVLDRQWDMSVLYGQPRSILDRVTGCVNPFQGLLDLKAEYIFL